MSYGPRTFLAAVTAACALALTGAAPALAACPNEDAIPTADNLDLIRDAVLCLHNEARQQANVALLEGDGRLTTAADAHAADMVTGGYFAHQSPTDVDPFDRLRQTEYIGRGIIWNAGETIAWASGSLATPKSIVDSWLDATTQRLTMLAPDFRDIGVGIALGAPVDRDPDALPAVTYTVDYGWRITQRSLRRCLRRAASRKRRPVRRLMRSRCYGLVARGAKVG
jgi:uncharacterized protein YkwD